MKLAISLIFALAVVFAGACLRVDTGDKLVAHAGSAPPWTVWEGIECCVDDRIATAMALAFQPGHFHCHPSISCFIHTAAKGTRFIRARLSIYKLNAAFLI